ncbi:Tyrosine--tRNA ligase [Buchnera aphidicola (Eriosoma grossulariae)]|uniref:tyrosine--tRNA ligase n=1 Tax=Buchnera aphidicola TaxID=9 RepID=UPI003463F1E8
MNSENIITLLKLRNLVFQISNENNLKKVTKNNSISLYCGFDPTADSLHIGHLLPLMVLKHFQILGHKPIILIGGATSLIGDPSFKLSERVLNTYNDINNWEKKITAQLSLFLDFNIGENSAKIVNNYHWFCKMDILSFLRKIGKYFSINQMINLESVKNRINRKEKGISFTEFTYSLLQSYDFVVLNNMYQVCLQIGGSDQWGNITSGINLVRKMSQKYVFGLTLPLLTKSDGTKFGKTEDGPIWLDSSKTSPYKFYQFWLNTDDSHVYTFLKWFTLLNYSEILKIEQEGIKFGNIIKDRIFLAKEITNTVHGISGVAAAVRITECLFSGDLNQMTELDFEQLKQDGMPAIDLFGSEDLVTALVISKFALSRSQARNMILSNAISINNKKISKIKYFFSNDDRLFNKFTLLKRGKKNYVLICWV